MTARFSGLSALHNVVFDGRPGMAGAPLVPAAMGGGGPGRPAAGYRRVDHDDRVGAAERTSTAYDDYLERADVGDLVINPSVSTRQISEVIAELPGVEHVSSDTVFVTTSDDGAPRTCDEVEQGGDVEQDGNSAMFVAGSHDGRYFEVDRPIVLSGRMPTGKSEAWPPSTSPAPKG